jgi:quinol monooxygenase YgiN
MPGLVACWLARSTTDQDMGCVVSLWSSRAAMQTYERSDAVRGEILPAVAPYLSSGFLAHHCEIDDGSEAGDSLPESRADEIL